MAYLPVDEEEQKKQAAAGGDHPLLAGFGGSSSPAPAGGAQAPTVQQPSSGFVPYSAYANANQGSAAKMASGLAGDIDKSAGAAQLGVANERNKFVDQVHAGSPYYKSPAEGLASWGGMSQQQAAPTEAPKTKAAYAPTPQAPKPGAGSTYTGPSEFSLSQGARDATTKASEQLANGTTDEGRQALLQSKYGASGGYNAGESRLDAALTGGAAGGQFEALKAKYGDLVGQMGQAELGANQVASSAKGMTDATTKANADQAAYSSAMNKGTNKPFNPNAPTDSFSSRWYAAHPGDRAKKNFWDNSDMDFNGFMNTKGGLARDYRPEQNAFRATFGQDTATAKAVFDSLTQEEFDNLKKMNKGTWAADSNNADEQVKQWLRARAHDLGVDPTGMAVGQSNAGTLTSLVGGG